MAGAAVFGAAEAPSFPRDSSILRLSTAQRPVSRNDAAGSRAGNARLPYPAPAIARKVTPTM